MADAEKSVDIETKEEKTKPLSMDDLTGADVFPDVQEHAVQAAVEKAAVEKAEFAKAETQNITYNKDGTPRKKRGPKPKGEKNFKNPRDIKAAQNIAPMVDSSQAAVVISGILEQMQVTLISDEFKYQTMERDLNVLAWKNTLDSYGGMELTPPMALAISHGAIILSRASQPKTKTKFEAAKIWFQLKLQKYQEKKKGAKNALSDRGANVEREIDVREKESKKSEGKS